MIRFPKFFFCVISNLFENQSLKRDVDAVIFHVRSHAYLAHQTTSSPFFASASATF